MNTTISSNSTFHYQVIEEVTDDFTKEHRYLLVFSSEWPWLCEEQTNNRCRIESRYYDTVESIAKWKWFAKKHSISYLWEEWDGVKLNRIWTLRWYRCRTQRQQPRISKQEVHGDATLFEWDPILFVSKENDNLPSSNLLYQLTFRCDCEVR